MTTEEEVELPRCHVCGNRNRYPARREGYSLCVHCGRDLDGPSPGMIRPDASVTSEEEQREMSYWQERGQDPAE